MRRVLHGVIAAAAILVAVAGCADREPRALDVVRRLLMVNEPLSPPDSVKLFELGSETRPTLGSVTMLSRRVKDVSVGGPTLVARLTTPKAAVGYPAAVDAKLHYGTRRPPRLLPLILLRNPLDAEFDAEFALPSDTQPGDVELEYRVRPLPPPAQEVETQAVEVAPGEILEVGLALDPLGKWVGASAAEVVLEARDATHSVRLLRKVLDPLDPATERWADHRVQLDAVSGKAVRFVFKSRALPPPGSEGEPAISFPLWGGANILASRPRAERPNVLLISLDTLRADQLGAYGSEYPTSPRLDALAREGAVFEQVMSVWPSTLMSHMTMLTGIYPASFTGILKVDHPLPDAIATLPEILAQAGYATAAVTEDGWIVGPLGFRRGFDSYRENRGVAFADARGEAVQTFADGLEWLRGHQDERFFLFLHTYQVHVPYTPPKEFDRFHTYRVGAEERPLAADAPHDARRRALYAGEVLYTDALLGQLLDGLGELGLESSTLIAVTADHGDAFGEHGLHGHANSLFGEVLNVPLVLRAPGLVRAGTRVKANASLVDLVPTILDLLGLVPPEPVDGESLVPLLRAGAAGAGDRPVFAQNRNPKQESAAVRTGSHKWIFDRHIPDGSRAYDLQSDPAEQVPLTDPILLARGEELLRTYLARAAERRARLGLDVAPAAAEPAEPDDETKAKLRALGYAE